MNGYQLPFCAVAACCTLVGSALGGIDTPPPWSNTGIVGNSTHWHWDFGPNGPPQVGTGSGPAGSNPPVITGGTFVPTLGADGAWLLQPGESMTIDMPNFPNPNDYKLIWVQYHLLGLAGALPQPPQIIVDWNGTTAATYGNPSFTPTPDGVIGAQGFRFPFNPPFEVFHIINASSAPLAFEWLTIDTICAPTPGAGAAFALTGMALLRRRR